MDTEEAAIAATITCETCGEELEWQPGYTLVHRGGRVGYLHYLVADEEQPEEVSDGTSQP